MISFFKENLINADVFADIAVEVMKHYNEYAFERILEMDRASLVDHFSIGKIDQLDYKQAFVLLIIKGFIANEMYFFNYHSTLIDDWKLFFEHCVKKEYFTKLRIKQMDASSFLYEISIWLKDCGYSQKQMEAFQNRYKEAKIIELSDIYAGHLCFGETENEFFLTEYGCGYD